MTIKSRIYKREEEIEIEYNNIIENVRMECCVVGDIGRTHMAWNGGREEHILYSKFYFISLFFDARRDKISIGLFECLRRLLNYHQNKLAFSRRQSEREKNPLHKLINIQNGLVRARSYFKQLVFLFS